MDLVGAVVELSTVFGEGLTVNTELCRPLIWKSTVEFTSGAF